jgi:hypothetical protein
MVLKKQIQAVLQREYKGPKVGYGEVDILKAVLAIGKSPGPLGRNKLGQLIGLGQGEVKTLISRLKESGLITVDASGCEFTKKGMKEFDSVSKAIPFLSQVSAQELRLGKFVWALLIRGKQAKIRKGIEQRDAAIIAGASGAVTVVYSSGRFLIPDGMEREGTTCTDCEALGPENLGQQSDQMCNRRRAM